MGFYLDGIINSIKYAIKLSSAFKRLSNDGLLKHNLTHLNLSTQEETIGQ